MLETAAAAADVVGVAAEAVVVADTDLCGAKGEY